jgi:hypothetical protein
VAVALAGTLLLAAGGAWSQDRYYLEMRDRFLRAAVMLTQAGFTLSHEPFVQTFGNQRYRDFTLQLQGGSQYAVFAVGDDDARDIDLEVYDDRGRLIAQDEGMESHALVGVEARYTAVHTVRVIMQDCRARQAYCWAGVGVFVR